MPIGETDQLLIPGRSCWRIEPAPKAGVLIDNAAYFMALEAALSEAQQSVFILGWEFDPRTRLKPGQESSAIGPLLNRLAAERPELEVHVLIWNAALGVAIGERLMPQRARSWFQSSRVKFRLDSTVPFGAAHHQKIVVVDDAVAFCSGDDLIVNRWDRKEHLDGEPARRTPSGSGYPPRHGTTAVVTGAAARALGELARARWQRATGELIPLSQAPGGDRWPTQTEPEFLNVEVAISRTLPQWRGGAEIRENEALFVDAIRSARHLLYFENQYFTSRVIGAELVRRLAEPDGPEVVMVTGEHAPSFFDRATMDGPRNALVHQLHDSDQHGRFRLYTPHAPDGRAVLVHSKLMIVDDTLLRIGSSNLADRSLGYDSECDLSFEARDGESREVISTVLHRLIGHYLGRRSCEVREKLKTTTSLIETIGALDEQSRQLRSLTGARPGFPKSLIARFHIGDPLSASEAWRPWRRT